VRDARSDASVDAQAELPLEALHEQRAAEGDLAAEREARHRAEARPRRLGSGR